VVLEVVAHVVGAQALPELRLRHVVMQVVVHVVVGQVARDEPGEDREGLGRPEDEDIEPEEESGERDADGRRHHQAHRVVGVVVVDAVDDEVEAVTAAELGLPVEEQAVEPVLGQRPDREPRQEEQRDAGGRQAPIDPEADAGDHDRHEDDRRDSRVDPGEEVEEAALEHRRRGREPRCPLVRHRR
jgi:hypothetical protein